MASSQPSKQTASSVCLLPQAELNITSDTKEKRLRILHVDDDTSYSDVSKKILSLLSNFEVDTAESVENAYKKMDAGSYDAVVSDYEMPYKNGLEFLMELRSQNNEIPFILLTGKGREEIAINALNLGADGYVSKHGNPETVYGELSHYIKQAVEKKQAKAALCQSERQLEAIVMNAPVGISASCSPSRFFEKTNAEFCKMLGYTEEELRTLTFKEITYPDDLQEIITNVEKLKTGKTRSFRLEKRFVRKDGSLIHGIVNANIVKEKDGKSCLFIIQLEDVTERKKADQGIKESEEKYKALFEQAGDYTLILEIKKDSVPTIFDANVAALNVHGYSRSEIIGKPITFIDDISRFEQVMERVTKALNGQKVTFSSKHRRKDGSAIEVEVSLKMVAVGSKSFLVSVERDITEHKKVLKQSEILYEKLGVIGSFTRHDVRNKLTAIEGNVYLAKKNSGGDSKMIHYLDHIHLAANSITRILDFAKNYEFLGSEQRTQTDVGKAIDQAASLISGFKGVELANQCRRFTVLADSMLATVFLNLIDNSLRHGKDLTKIRIYHREGEDGSQRIIYEDDGGGISDEDKTHLFTKGFGQGTGYGLYLIKRTCDIYGWTVKESGEFGKGVRFEFNLPASVQNA